MNFIFEQIRIGGDRNFGYLVGDRAAGEAVAIDPAYMPGEFAERARVQSVVIKRILNTHGHDDHVNGNDELARLTGAELKIGFADGDTFSIGSIQVKVLCVPGHADDHVLFWMPGHSVAITGDLLFVGKIGGTATKEDARKEYDSLNRVFETLPDDTTIWPGHDYGARPASTIALEKASNPFLQVRDFDEFLKMKADWPRFKLKHGLK
ncbi:MAG: hydroxyacylglutathione hydrolase family protein [Planctomycetota bacterium]|nr:hydroxyacylglutathione hydrolase family protein [Planctomycetota bacterium]